MQDLYNEGVSAFGCGFPTAEEADLCFKAFCQCARLIDESAVFSSNEEIGDVPTSSLKYLLVPYYLGVVRQRLPCPDATPAARLALLQQSRADFVQLLRKLESLGVLEKADASAYQDMLDGMQLRADSASLSELFVPSTVPASRERALQERDRLLERARRLQSAKKQLAALEERKARLRLDDDDDDDHNDSDAAECEREHWLLLLAIRGAEAVDELKSLLSEEQMLQQAVRLGLSQQRASSSSSSSAPSTAPSPARSSSSPSTAAASPKIFHISEPGATPQPLLSLADAPKPKPKSKPAAQPGAFSTSRAPGPIRRGLLSPEEAAAAVELAAQTPGGGIAPGHVHLEALTRVADGVQDRIDKRQLVKDAVFQPGWRLPTLMVEEAAEIEMQFAAKGPGGEASRRHADNDDGVDGELAKADNDDEVKKQREWDDWCDYNPTGSGNRMRQG